MATIEYDITHYQPILFGADSIDHLVDAVGSFFADLRRRDSGPVRNRERSGRPAGLNQFAVARAAGRLSRVPGAQSR